MKSLLNLTYMFWLTNSIFFIWLAILTFFLFRTLVNYNRLTQGITEKTLTEVLKDFLNQDKLTQKELARVRTEINQIKKGALRHIQKIGLVRFNPFADTGGHQSFSMALLDGDNHGIVITSLYARTGVRWYVKTIQGGKGVEHELSKEEKEAINNPIKYQITKSSKRG